MADTAAVSWARCLLLFLVLQLVRKRRKKSYLQQKSCDALFPTHTARRALQPPRKHHVLSKHDAPTLGHLGLEDHDKLTWPANAESPSVSCNYYIDIDFRLRR